MFTRKTFILWNKAEKSNNNSKAKTFWLKLYENYLRSFECNNKTKIILHFEDIFGPTRDFCLALEAAEAEEVGFFITISQSGEGERL